MKMKINEEDDESLSSSSSEEVGVKTTSDSRAQFDERQEAEKEVADLAESANKRIYCARWVVFALLLSAGAAVSYYIHYILHNEEVSDYEDGLKLFLNALETAAVRTVFNFFSAMNDLSEAVTLSSDLSFYTADFEASRFPFVTMDFFESRASHVRKQAGFPAVFWAPIVEEYQADAWSLYAQNNSRWLWESREFELATTGSVERDEYKDGDFIPFIYEAPINETTGEVKYIKPTYPGPYAPLWQVSPPPLDTMFVGHDKFDKIHIKNAFQAAARLRTAVYTDFFDLRRASSLRQNDDVHALYHQQFTDDKVTAESAYERPHSMIIAPIYSRIGDTSSKIVGIAGSVIAWDQYLLHLLPDGVRGIYCVLKSECDGNPKFHTYLLNGDKASYLGEGDSHDPAFDNTGVTVSLMDPDLELQFDVAIGHCLYSMTAYSSKVYRDSVVTSLPLLAVLSISAVFLLVILFFFMYDCFVKRRNDIVIDAATRSNAVLLELFPKQVRDRMLADKNNDSKADHFMSESKEGKPNADFFPETTIMFADICGFTSWSSSREPPQVFILLETLYQAFDEIAKKRRVFKVETIGDCYVAVCGLPTPQKDHAVVMTRFANECMDAMHSLVQEMEVTLGPGTGDLNMRIGLNSGATTAGVLRGERARFQLFGDTMNTASRMESGGVPGRIHISESTANLLKAAGKEKWITERKEGFYAKGKGHLKTFFAKTTKATGSVSSGTTDSSDPLEDCKTTRAKASRESRTIEWMVDVIKPLMRDIVARRTAFGTPTIFDAEVSEEQALKLHQGSREYGVVKETVYLPQKFYESIADKETTVDPKNVVLDSIVVEELGAFVRKIASTYRDNEFHNFDHAAHVTQSVSKLLSRIVGGTDYGKIGLANHRRSFGITSDPYTSFAAVLAALAHDIDHQGVPNAQLITEKHPHAIKYDNKCVAEQNSFDKFWTMFMAPEYSNFRKSICCNDKALLRFRDLVLNLLMATDISDKELKTFRDARWNRAFAASSSEDNFFDMNRKATIVLEHLIQASDVSHTMQHWHVYIKYNRNFFFECTKAFVEGRAETDPAVTWYKGEIGFFDFYIIPLARKLASCGVFGVSSDEYLDYAISNRNEWEMRGKAVLEDMIEDVKKKPWYKDPTRRLQKPGGAA